MHTDLSSVQYTINGANRFAYREIGTGSPLLLLNRFRGTIDDWDPAFITKLAESHKVISFDNMGIGATGGTPDQSIEGMAKSAYLFIQALGIKTLNLFGWSMGGLVAQVFALNYPDMVKKIILAGTAPGGSPETEYPSAKFLEIATEVYHLKAEHHQQLFFTEGKSGLNNTLTSLARIEAAANPDEVPINPIETWKAQGSATRSFLQGTGNYFSKLKEINHPVLVAGAKNDIAFSAKNSFLLYRELPKAKLILYSNAGHAFHHQLYEEFGQAVNNFLISEREITDRN
ncbi:MAG: alpha/beta hydrolase [Balneolaceae bacterium]|nr:alpha/beta hydrolase [Balneolaceae bacterium]